MTADGLDNYNVDLPKQVPEDLEGLFVSKGREILESREYKGGRWAVFIEVESVAKDQLSPRPYRVRHRQPLVLVWGLLGNWLSSLTFFQPTMSCSSINVLIVDISSIKVLL